MTNVIDSNKVPKKTLTSGEKIPCIGMGTFGSDRFTATEIADAVAGAIQCGYRMFDCAFAADTACLTAQPCTETKT